MDALALHHVGVATPDAETLAALYRDLFRAPVVHEERFEGMEVLFLEVGGGYFELLEPGDEGPIARHLSEHGRGIHHVAFATPDLGAALDRARDLGVDLVDESPRPGAWGHEVAFLHPNSTGGVLVEFVGVEGPEGGTGAGATAEGDPGEGTDTEGRADPGTETEAGTGIGRGE